MHKGDMCSYRYRRVGGVAVTARRRLRSLRPIRRCCDCLQCVAQPRARRAARPLADHRPLLCPAVCGGPTASRGTPPTVGPQAVPFPMPRSSVTAPPSPTRCSSRPSGRDWRGRCRRKRASAAAAGGARLRRPGPEHCHTCVSGTGRDLHAVRARSPAMPTRGSSPAYKSRSYGFLVPTCWPQCSCEGYMRAHTCDHVCPGGWCRAHRPDRAAPPGCRAIARQPQQRMGSQGLAIRTPQAASMPAGRQKRVGARASRASFLATRLTPPALRPVVRRENLPTCTYMRSLVRTALPRTATL